MEKKSTETAKKYVQRCREMVIQINPPLSNKKLINIFANTFKAPYYERMTSIPLSNVIDIVIIVKSVKYGIKIGKITDVVAESNAPKKNDVIKKNEREVHQVETKI